VGGAVASGLFPQMARKLMPEVREQNFPPDAALREKQRARGLRVGDITVSQGLSKDVVLNIAQKNIGGIERCYPGNELRGKLVLELIISSSGRIKTAKIISSPLKDRDAERCLIDSVKHWKFPATQGGQEVKASITFIFGAE
jgi:hypothetical protein